MLTNYLKIAWRNLVRNRALSTINIVGLSAGLTAVMFILLFVQDEVSYDCFHAQAGQLYRVVLNTTTPGGREIVTGATGLPQGPAFAAELPEVADFCRVQGYEMLVRKKEEALYQQVMYVDPSFLRLFSFNLLAGNPNTLLNDPGTVVITDDMARTYFGTYYIQNKAVKSGNEWIDDQYLNFVTIPILAGRGFCSANPADSLSNILVNETFVRQFLAAGKPAVGQVIQRQEQDDTRSNLTVVGVVRDYQYRSLRDKPEPVLFQLGRPEQMNQLYAKLTPGQAQAGLQALKYVQTPDSVPAILVSFHGR